MSNKYLRRLFRLFLYIMLFCVVFFALMVIIGGIVESMPLDAACTGIGCLSQGFGMVIGGLLMAIILAGIATGMLVYRFESRPQKRKRKPVDLKKY